LAHVARSLEGVLFGRSFSMRGRASQERARVLTRAGRGKGGALFLAEGVEADDSGGIAGGRLRRRRRRFGGRGSRGGAGRPGLELEAELDARIEEALNRRIRNDEPFGNLAEGEIDGKAILHDLEVPELMLKHDGYFLGILLAQPLGNIDARRVRAEGNVEMMLARQALVARYLQRGADHAAKRLLRHDIVMHQIFGQDT